MHSTKNFVLIVATYWNLLAHLILSDPLQWVNTLTSFTDLDGNAFDNVVVDYNNSGDVFVSGRNVLYRLSADLELKQRVATGPLEDFPGCPVPPLVCERERVPTANQNALLKMIYHWGSPPSLLFCGTAYRTLCQVIPTSNLSASHWIHPHNESVSSGGRRHHTRAFFGSGFNGQWALFTASSSTGSNRTPSFVPFLTSRVLEREAGDRYSFRYAFHNDTAASSVTLKEQKERIVVDGGFVHEEFAYFLLSKTAGSSVDSLLGRFCTGQDATFQSYAELPLECHRSDTKFTQAVALHFGDAPDNSAEKVIYTTFYKGGGGGSVLCVFPMAKVAEAFTQSRKYCNSQIVGETCATKKGRDISDFCGAEAFPYLVRKPLVTKWVVPFQSAANLVAVTTVKHGGEMLAIVGADDSSIRKVNLSTGKVISSNYMHDTRKGSFRNPFVFDGDRENIYILMNDKILKYPVASCGPHERCSVCLTHGRSDPLRCGWCGGHCAHLEECGGDTSAFSRDTCTPSIHQVSPLTGPVQGGVSITITGDSLGSHEDAFGVYSVSVAGIPCQISSWDHFKVRCVLGSAPEGTAGPVRLSVTTNHSSSVGYNVAGTTTSHQNFSYYVGPRLFGIRPAKGPDSGGTNVTLVGHNLEYDKDKERSFIIRRRLCTFVRFSRDKNSVHCLTGNETRIEYPDSIAVRIGDIDYVIDESPPPNWNVTDFSRTFQYTEDPKIVELMPRITTMSGLKNVTATGTHLDSVQFPKMVVKINVSTHAREMEIQEDCWSDPKYNGTTLTCRTPSLLKVPGIVPPLREKPLPTRLAFLMDGVRALKEFPEHNRAKSRLDYYPDPWFQKLRGIEKMSADSPVLEIKGSSLDLINPADDNFEVKIGEDESCDVTMVSSESMLCELPSRLLTNSYDIGAKFSVEVIMGYDRINLSHIEITQQDVKRANSGYLWLILLIVIPVLGIAVAYVVYVRSTKRKSRLQFDGGPLTYQAGSSTTTTTTDYASSIRIAGEGGETMPIVDSETMLLLQDKNLLIPRTCLQFGEKVGAGQFGCVFEGLLRRPEQGDDDVRVAIKTLREHAWSNPQSAETFLREALIMKDFDHPNVLHLLGICFEGGGGPSIVLPFMENGDLCSYLKDDTKTLLVSNLLQFAVDVAAGMTYLGEKKFVHRDLAARNCILDSCLHVRVADFGLSRDVYTDDYYCCENKKAMLPYRWMAPESLEKSLYSVKTDVWSYGILLWELMTRGSIPYANVGSWDVLQYIKLGNRLDQPERCPEPIYRVMLACWNKESKKRPSFHELQVYLDQVQQWLRCTKHTKDSGEIVPAQHTMYYNSKELYHNMDDYVLDTELV